MTIQLHPQAEAWSAGFDLDDFPDDPGVPVPRIDELNRYWTNPAPFDAETQAHRDRANAAIDAGIARYWGGRL